MSDSLPPLDPRMRALLDDERRIASRMPAAADKRVATKITAVLGAGVLGAGTLGTTTTAAATITAAATTSASAGGTVALGTALIVGGIVFAVGLGSGVGIHALVEEPRIVERRVEVVRVVHDLPHPSEAPTPSPTLAPATAAPTIAPDDAVDTHEDDDGSNRATPRHRTATLAPLSAEVQVLNRARAAVASGHGADALAALQDHRQQFPDGRLAEERDALTVRALVEASRIDDARAAAHRFRRKYPHSVFQTAVDAAIEHAGQR